MTADLKIDRTLDLQGEVCPYTFVKGKLALEEMNAGEVLLVLVDYPPAVENVPRSMEGEGNQILWVKERGTSLWEIVVRKSEA